jgi:hypothetical protein
MTSSGQDPLESMLARLREAVEHASAEFERARKSGDRNEVAIAFLRLERAVKALKLAILGPD